MLFNAMPNVPSHPSDIKLETVILSLIFYFKLKFRFIFITNKN
jgi:hypothetical protein